jgi:tetraacyldisaccharide 4'-kinase
VSTLADRLLPSWYGEVPPPLWARSLEPFYRTVVRARRYAYRNGLLRSGHPGRPVIVVGNLTAGGAGKTPMVIWLSLALAARGRHPAVVSRGYGGIEPDVPMCVAAGDNPAVCGDEPLMIAKATRRPVWVSRDRLAAARAAVAAGADVIIADDGLQHYRLRRDIEIVVVDGMRGFGNGRCLPAGPLREPVGRLLESDFVICNGAGRCPDGALAIELEGSEARSLDGSLRKPLSEFKAGPVHAIAGIANPERFFVSLERHGLELIRHPLPDHGVIAPGLLAPGDGRPVLMTSKDAARCGRDPAAARAWEVPVEVRFEDDGREWLDALAQRAGLREA